MYWNSTLEASIVTIIPTKRLKETGDCSDMYVDCLKSYEDLRKKNIYEYSYCSTDIRKY